MSIIHREKELILAKREQILNKIKATQQINNLYEMNLKHSVKNYENSECQSS